MESPPDKKPTRPTSECSSPVLQYDGAFSFARTSLVLFRAPRVENRSSPFASSSVDAPPHCGEFRLYSAFSPITNIAYPWHQCRSFFIRLIADNLDNGEAKPDCGDAISTFPGHSCIRIVGCGTDISSVASRRRQATNRLLDGAECALPRPLPHSRSSFSAFSPPGSSITDVLYQQRRVPPRIASTVLRLRLISKTSRDDRSAAAVHFHHGGHQLVLLLYHRRHCLRLNPKG